VAVQFFQHAPLVPGQHHADEYLGQAEIRTYAYIHDGDERIAQQAALIALENAAELFLYQPAEFLLSDGSTHGVKIRNPSAGSGQILSEGSRGALQQTIASVEAAGEWSLRIFGYLRKKPRGVLRYFRINDPYRLISLLVLMVLASLPLLIDPPDITLQEIRDMVVGERVGNKILYIDLVDRTPPLMAVADGVLNLLFGRSLLARHLLALIILFFQASYFAVLLIHNRAYNENTYVPSLIFGLLCFLSFDLLSVTPELLGATVLLFALNSIFKEIEFRIDKDSIMLNLGLFIGLASLFVLSYAIFLPGTIVILAFFARSTFRKLLLVVLGFFLVHGILLTLYYYYGQPEELWRNFYLAHLDQTRSLDVGLRTLMYLAAVPLFFFLVSLLMLTREAHFTRYQSQLFQVLFIWLIVAATEALLSPGIAPHSFITVLPPLAYFIGHFLLLIRRKRISEFMLWVFIVGILGGSYAIRKGFIQGTDYSRLFATASPYQERIKGKDVMVVGHDPGLYRYNSLGGGFFDWDLSREYFEHPEFYEHVIRMNNAFNEDPPEVIIDERGLMPAVMDRLPMVARHYRRDSTTYWRRESLSR